MGRLNGIGKKDVLRAIERVGLAGREKDLVRGYSLGMKQRLGLAAALMKDPELLILDEPAHGLDPAGIKEIRGLLRQLGDEGRTVFLSSHLLSEVQAICDRVAILSRGKCIAQGTVLEVLERGRSAGVMVRLPDLERGISVLTDEGFQASIETGFLTVNIDPAHAGEITQALAAKNLFVTELRPREVSLEDVFLELTGEDAEEVR
jgi:ABC-2 type transport system ATP-binding protein